MESTMSAAACDCTPEEHYDAADALGAFCDRLMALRREHEEFAPGDEIAALKRAESLISARIQRIRDHAYAVHGVQRQARI